MKRLCTIAAAVALLVLVGSRALGGGHCGDCCCEAPPKPTPDHKFLVLDFVPLDFEVHNEKLIEKECVRPVTCVECVPVWEEKQKTITEYHKVAKEIEKEVVSCRLVPECTCDPCTGCTKVCYKKEMCVHKVKCCVWECVPETKVVTEKVCTMKKVEKTVMQKYITRELVDEVTKEPVTLVRFCPYKGKINPLDIPGCPVPAGPPCPTCAPGCGH
jgi:hypothetical protein